MGGGSSRAAQPGDGGGTGGALGYRKESRGLHYNVDYPERDDARWLHDTIIQD